MQKIANLAAAAVRATGPRAVSQGHVFTLDTPLVSKRQPLHTGRALFRSYPTESDRADIYELRNGDKIPNIFSESEYQNRIDKLRSHMVENHIGACVLTSYSNILYYTGYLYYSWGRNYAFVVKHDDTKLITSPVNGGNPWRRCYGDNIVYTDWQKKNFFKALKQTIGDAEGSIGLEHDDITVKNFPNFTELFSKRDLVDIDEATMSMRLIKSPAEQEVFRQGARIADIGGDAVVEALHEGVAEYEVMLHAVAAMTREVAQTFPHSEIRDIFAWVQSGMNTDGCHNPSTSRRIQKGDNISMNLFPMMAGYYYALERTLAFDHASDTQLKYWQANVDVFKRGLGLIKPGARCCDIALQLNEMYREKDLLQYRTFGYGHSPGPMCHYYGRASGLELQEHVTTVLEPGMVLTLEPMIMIPEGREGAGGYRDHDTLIVTETGAENITKFPFGPENNIIRK